MPSRKERILAGRALLAERFPGAIAPKGGHKKPLKIGIRRDIRDALPELSSRDLNLVLWDYTSGPRYLRVMVEGADRVGLDGQPSGFVTKDAAQGALAALETEKQRQAKARAQAAARRAQAAPQLDEAA